MTPRFSVIIPTLNEEKFLPKLLSSLAAQTQKDFEVIVVDGKSKDNTIARARSFAKKLPHFHVLTAPYARLPLQRNLGAKAAKGKWFIFIDADSVLLPQFIERISLFIKDHQPKLFTTWFCPDSENPKDAVYTLFGNIYIEATVIFKKPLPPGPLAIIERSAFDAVGGYDETHAFHEDVDFGLRLFKRGIHLAILRESLCIWSLRRFRKEGTFKVLNQYVLGILPVVFVNRSLKHMPGYIMGGHLYEREKNRSRGTIKRYERKIIKFLRDFFA